MFEGPEKDKALSWEEQKKLDEEKRKQDELLKIQKQRSATKETAKDIDSQ